ncbi:thiamine phosphate synthase [Sediminibacterium sp.]|uniref:thiamine phosphate synthase n=1 Tax=Sediminibacterium sp. TaxID=1917865 RepID=UPI00271D611E|nr:thiamine phosphate synthase [Sediminibacterium sp.]MDO9000322.1 thiamine phosphate synthase [Bacteroidota bacterium]MDP3147109.1 thiamine phosphate synthase [Bacteroidota bacterium]MDP3567362.1 thiamine phosphate synthase [Sediminibacterium sp.]
MKLFIITSSKEVPDETTLITKMFESGLTNLHIRKPKLSTNQMSEYINEIPAHFHKYIVIHSHHKLALKYNLKGIHLTSTHLSKRWKYFFVRLRLKFKFEKISKSRSYSKLQQAYNKEEYVFDYILMGTMFNSFTGEFYSGYYDAGVRAALKNSGKRFVARGGTTPSVVGKASELGFYGLAFNSYIWDHPSPYENFTKILGAYKECNLEI